MAAVAGTPSVLRVCLDSFSLANGTADSIVEIVLDNSRGVRCEPLVVRTSAAALEGRASDGIAEEATFHGSGVFSHRLVCSDSSAPNDDCAYMVAHEEGVRKYSASCDPLRSHCYSMPEYQKQNAQPLWCCDFDSKLANTAKHVQVAMWDEGKLGDDRVGNVTLAVPELLAKLRASSYDGSVSVSLALEATAAGGGGTISLWSSLVPQTAASARAARLERKKRAVQISYWGAFGPDDVKILARHRTASTSAKESSLRADRARRQGAARRMQEWKLWQALPLLGALEQAPEVLMRRRASLSAAPASATELGIGNMDACVVTTATGAKYDGSQPVGAALLRNKEQFCKACGYRCLLSTAGNHATSRPAKWDKLIAVHDALRSCSVVMHVDADVVIRRPFRIEPLARTWLTASRDFDGLNSGVLLVRRTRQVRELFDFAWRQTSFNTSFSAEQNAIRLALRRPYSAPSRSRLSLVTILEGLVEFPFYKSPLLSKMGREVNHTSPLYHTAGCTANQGRIGSGMCDDLLLKQLPPDGLAPGVCPSVEVPYETRSKALLQHMQELGSTTMGRRWMRGRDLRIKYTDQKGSRRDGWWNGHPGCSEVGCDDPDSRKRAEKKARKEAHRGGELLHVTVGELRT